MDLDKLREQAKAETQPSPRRHRALDLKSQVKTSTRQMWSDSRGRDAELSKSSSSSPTGHLGLGEAARARQDLQRRNEMPPASRCVGIAGPGEMPLKDRQEIFLFFFRRPCQGRSAPSTFPIRLYYEKGRGPQSRRRKFCKVLDFSAWAPSADARRFINASARRTQLVWPGRHSGTGYFFAQNIFLR